MAMSSLRLNIVRTRAYDNPELSMYFGLNIFTTYAPSLQIKLNF